MVEKWLRLGLIQMKMGPSAKKNLDKAVSMTERAAKQGADIVCLPELFTSTYFAQHELTQPLDITDLAVEVPGELSKKLGACAKDNGVVLVAGSIYELFKGKLFNTSLVFDERGRLLGKYRKTHIPHDESYYEQHYFAPGDTGFQVFQTSKAKIGVLICYDQWFPEAARCLALQGADIILYPTAIGTVRGIRQAEGNWHRAWENVMRGHAIANGTIVAAVNRVGTEERMRFWGGSFVIDAFGKTLARAGSQEQVLVAEADLAHSEAVREGWRFFANRRPECYGRLLEKKRRD